MELSQLQPVKTLVEGIGNGRPGSIVLSFTLGLNTKNSSLRLALAKESSYKNTNGALFFKQKSKKA